MIHKVPKVLKIIIFVCLLFESNFGLHGQKILQPSPIDVEELGVNQGLSQGMINCIHQDKEGFIWIATKDGLNRYNGYTIFTFRNNPNDRYSLPDNYCNSMTEDDKGNLWVGTNTKGLFLFDKTTERFYNVSVINTNSNNLCIRELQYAKGKLFVRTFNDVLILDISKQSLNNDDIDVLNINVTFSFEKTPTGKKQKSVYINMDYLFWSWMPDNVLWASMQDSIYKFEPSDDITKWHSQSFSATTFGIKEKTHGYVYFFPISGASDSMIIAYNSTIAHYNNKTGKIFYKKSLSETPESNFDKYFKLNDGSIYTLTDSSANIYNPANRETEIVLTNFPSKSYCVIFTLFTDVNGIQWFGSNGCGIFKRDPRKKRFKSFKDVHPKEVFSKLPPSLMPPISPKFIVAPEFGDVVLDKDGIYWALLMKNYETYTRDLYSHDTKTGNITFYNKFSYDFFRAYIHYTNGELWLICTDKTKKYFIARFDKRTGAQTTSYKIPESFDSPEPYISQLYKDNHGVMWLASINGLYALNVKNETWKHWKNIPNDKQSISADGVLSICPDPNEPDKYLWLGTEGGGMNRFEISTGNCINYNENNGLPNNVAYCILSDSLNNLWISTNKGLSCFDPLHKTFRTYTYDDGLPGSEFNRYAALRMQNGELMFGGVGGFVIFNPKEVLTKQPAAPLVFTSVTISNNTISWPNDNKNIDAPIGFAKVITLQPGQNIFSINFATLEYRSNQKKMYKYKLDGFDTDWSNPSSKNEVTYTNLSPGNYTFYVMGANTDGIWNEKTISMDIVVKPFWYQTLLFKFLSIALFAYLLYSFYHYRLHQRLQIEKIRNRIARDLHDEIGSTLSSISIYAAAAKKVITGNDKADNILSKINTGTSEMMEAMSDIVWAVNTGSGHFYDLVNRVRSFVVQVTEEKNIELHFTDNKDLPEIALNMEQRKNIYLICKEAVSNAVKYSGCTLLEVLISTENHRLHILIHDNGKGFESSSFESDTSGHSFGGNGIKNMRYRAAEIDAKLTLYSNLGDGTSIELIAPCKIS